MSQKLKLSYTCDDFSSGWLVFSYPSLHGDQSLNWAAEHLFVKWPLNVLFGKWPQYAQKLGKYWKQYLCLCASVGWHEGILPGWHPLQPKSRDPMKAITVMQCIPFLFPDSYVSMDFTIRPWRGWACTSILTLAHVLAVCSHRRAYYYYEEAIKKGKGFTGVPCDSWEDFKAGNCKDNSQKTIQLANDSKNPKWVKLQLNTILTQSYLRLVLTF